MKVAIIASGWGKYDAPLGNPEWECWGVNQTWQHFNHPVMREKFARWFELHRRAFLNWENPDDPAHITFLRLQDRTRLYVQDKEEWPDIPQALEFPMERVQALAPDFGYYHACSIDWMIAFAIVEGAQEIALYGVEQQHTAEPFGSRACMEFWSGFAVARGIKVSSVQGSTFKLAHLCYTKIPYAVDPTWLPFEDRTDPDSTISKNRRELQKAVDADSRPVGFHRE